jgi:hypothetical protein
MAYAARHADLHAIGSHVHEPARHSLLRRLFDAVFESRQRQAEHAVEAYLARTGHRFTDSLEREINEHMFNGGWNARR